MKKFTFKNISENISISDSKNILNGKIINTSPDLDLNKDTCVNNYYSDNTPSAKSQIQIPVYNNSQFITLLPGDDISIITDNDLVIEYYTNVVNSLNSETYSFIDCKIEDDPGPEPQKPLSVPFSVLASDFIEGPTGYPTYIYEYGSDLALDKQYSIVLNSTSGKSYSVDFTMESFDGILISYVEFDTQDTLPITDGYICNNASFDPEVGFIPGDSFMMAFMGDGTLEDFHSDIIDFNIKEASAPTKLTVPFFVSSSDFVDMDSGSKYTYDAGSDMIYGGRYLATIITLDGSDSGTYEFSLDDDTAGAASSSIFDDLLTVINNGDYEDGSIISGNKFVLVCAYDKSTLSGICSGVKFESRMLEMSDGIVYNNEKYGNVGFMMDPVPSLNQQVLAWAANSGGYDRENYNKGALAETIINNRTVQYIEFNLIPLDDHLHPLGNSLVVYLNSQWNDSFELVEGEGMAFKCAVDETYHIFFMRIG